MKSRIFKLIVCFLLVATIMVGFCSAFASAATPVWLLRAKAGIAAAMFASNLFINPINAAVDDTLLEGVDPIGYVTSIQDTPWTEYIDQNVIVVRPDTVTIDGVEYSDIWIGPDAADSLRLAGLDFASAYNIISNQSSAITYASGAGYVDDIPIYSVNGELISQTFILGQGANSVGPWTITITPVPDANYAYADFNVVSSAGSSTVRKYVPKNQFQGYYSYIKVPANTSNGTNRFGFTGSSSSSAYGQNTLSNVYDADPFRFDYTSGQIDVVPDPEDGLLLRVPSSYDDGQTGSVFNYDIHDLINIYPQVDDTNGHELIFDPNLNPDFDVDLDMGNALGDIITAVILAKLADLLGDDAEIIYAPMPEKDEPGPVDPDLPDPDVPIGEQDPVWLDNLLRWLKQTIDNLGDRIHDSIDTIHEDIQELIQQLSELPETILEDIELGPAKLIDKALDVLRTLFLPILAPISAMMGLWHYVVEWITSISTPFTWIFGIMSGTSGNMVLPIYATLAGGICISIYKVFGR